MILNIYKIESCICFFFLCIIFSSCEQHQKTPVKVTISSVKKLKTPQFDIIQGFSLENFEIDSNHVKKGKVSAKYYKN